MSKLGNYVHLTARGYEESGINMPHAPADGGYTLAAHYMKDNIKKKIDNMAGPSDADILKFETNLKYLIQLLGDGEKTRDEKNYSNQIKKYLTQELSKEFNEINKIDFNNLTTYTSSRVNQLSSHYTSFKDWRSKIVNRVSELNNYLQHLQKFYTNLQKMHHADGSYLNNINILIEKLDKTINETYQKTWDHLAAIGYEPVNKKTVRHLVRDLNAIINEYNQIPILNNMQDGNNTLFNDVVALIPIVGENLVKKEIQQKIKNSKIGNTTMRVSVDSEKKVSKQKTTSLGEIRKKVAVNNNLIHVDFDWDNKKGLNAQVQEIKLLDNKFQFIKGAYQESLDFLLEEDPFFGNHYLNLFTQHFDSRSVSWEGLKQLYKETLKMLLIYKAFTGDGINRDITEIIILKSGTNVKVYSLRKILQKVMESDSKYSSVVSTNGNVRDGDLFKNKKVQAADNMAGARQRIANVLLQAHQRKVQASFNSAILRDL